MQASPEGGTRRARLEAEARDIAREVSCRRSNLYATREFQDDAEARLADLLANSPKDPEVALLAAQLTEGRILERYRREQAALMPAVPATPAAIAAHRALGEARFEMAQSRLRMDLNGADSSEWNLWQDRHLEAAQRASLAAAELSAIERAGSDSGWRNLPPDQQRELRDLVADNGTFDTPIAPRNYRDVAEETQDIFEGHQPVREAINDTGFAPFGPTEPRQRTPSDQDARDTTSTTAAAQRTARDGIGGQKQPPPPDRARRLTQQKRRREARSRGVRALMRDIKANQRYLKQLDRAVDSADIKIASPLNQNGSMFDLTMLSFLLETIDKSR